MKNRLIKLAYNLLFFLVWLAGMYHMIFYRSNVYMHGLKQPIGNYFVPYDNHGNVVYITQEENFYLQLYVVLIAASIPCLLILAFILHFAFGIEMFR